MSWRNRSHLIFLDLEATCAKDNLTIPRTDRETIEIGAVAIETKSGSIVSEFQEYVRPVVHKELTEFCRELTAIDQATVDGAAFFPHAFARFSEWVAGYPAAPIFTWGHYDKKQLLRDSRRHEIKFSVKNTFHDFKNIFYRRQKLLHRVGLEATLRQVGLDFEGRPHGALADAKNTARLIRFVL